MSSWKNNNETTTVEYRKGLRKKRCIIVMDKKYKERTMKNVVCY